MLKRKQQQEQQESERKELGLEREDLEGISSDSESENEIMSDDNEMSDDEENVTGAKGAGNSGSSKTKVMILSSRGINSRYNFSIKLVHFSKILNDSFCILDIVI